MMDVRLLEATVNAQTLMYLAMHQDHSSHFVTGTDLTDNECGAIVVRRCLKGGKGHYGPLEHASLTFTCGYVPHYVWQQVTRHRIGVTFDIQSFRYTGDNVIAAVEDNNFDEIFEVVTEAKIRAAEEYTARIKNKEGYQEARRVLPMDTLQHGIVTFNLRSFLHFLDLRAKPNAQPKTVELADRMFDAAYNVAPAIMEWYYNTRYKKGQPAP